MSYLIVNGDDLGLSPGVNRGILDAHRQGVVTSASLMVLRPASEEAAALARRTPGLSVGLHLELENETEDPTIEMARQLTRFEQLLGRPPTHVDGHHDGHLRPRHVATVMDVGRRFGIPVRGRSPIGRLSCFYGQWDGRTHLEQIGVDNLIHLVRTRLLEGVTELICHPGYVDPSLRSGYTVEREAEVATLCDARVREALDRSGVYLIGFRDLPASGVPDQRSRDDQ